MFCFLFFPAGLYEASVAVKDVKKFSVCGGKDLQREWHSGCDWCNKYLFSLKNMEPTEGGAEEKPLKSIVSLKENRYHFHVEPTSVQHRSFLQLV